MKVGIISRDRAVLLSKSGVNFKGPYLEEYEVSEKTAPSRFKPRWVQSIAKRIIENGLSLAEIVLFEIGKKNVKIELDRAGHKANSSTMRSTKFSLVYSYSA